MSMGAFDIFAKIEGQSSHNSQDSPGQAHWLRQDLAKPIDILRRLWYIPRQQPNTVLLSREVEGPAL
jgi:hypothetical protein